MLFVPIIGWGGDSTAPTLSSATDSGVDQTTGSGSVTTDEANGTLYWVVTTSATSPSAAQVKAGQDHTGSAASDSGSQSVSSTGAQAVSGGFTGLTADTQYYAHYMHEDAATNQSAVASANGFRTWSSDLISNGTFASDTVWSKGTGWSIGSGVASHTGGAGSITQSIAFVAGATYRVTFTLSGYSAGSFRPRFLTGTAVDGTNRSADGTYQEDLVAVTGNDTFAITATSTGVGNIDNVTMYRIA